MEISLALTVGNSHPLTGLLLRGGSPESWLKSLQELSLSIDQVLAYPIPSLTPNRLWGCFIQLNDQEINVHHRHEYCQSIDGTFFIPEKSKIVPYVESAELIALLIDRKCVFHPDFGLVELVEKIDWPELIDELPLGPCEVQLPQAGPRFASQVLSYQILSSPAEDVLEDFEKEVRSEKKVFKDKPLNIFEKAKLAFYRNVLFDKSKEDKSTAAQLKSGLKQFFDRFKAQPKVLEKAQEDFEDLDERNQKELDKLLDLFEKDPDEALKYAIPLDDSGVSRGGNKGSFSMLNRQNSSGGGGGTVDLGDGYEDLRSKYMTTAQSFINQGKHKKAAFIYLKLLKEYYLAAQTFEKGKHYEEAASVYLKHCNNKSSAAKCYEDGAFYQKAIDIYEELNENEKVGDLYKIIGDTKRSHVYYEKVIDEYKLKNRLLKAAQLYEGKMGDRSQAQTLLMQGWEKGIDSFNCLHNYLRLIGDEELVLREVQRINSSGLNDAKARNFLDVLIKEYKGRDSIPAELREEAYKLIASRVNIENFTMDLVHFNPDNVQLMRDLGRLRG